MAAPLNRSRKKVEGGKAPPHGARSPRAAKDKDMERDKKMKDKLQELIANFGPVPVLSDDEWRIVLFMVEGEENYDDTAIQDAIRSGRRRRFTVLHHDSILQWVRDHKDPVCLHAKAYVDMHENIPEELLAMVVLRKLEEDRVEGIERKEEDRREAERKRQAQLEKEKAEREALQAALRGDTSAKSNKGKGRAPARGPAAPQRPPVQVAKGRPPAKDDTSVKSQPDKKPSVKGGTAPDPKAKTPPAPQKGGKVDPKAKGPPARGNVKPSKKPVVPENVEVIEDEPPEGPDMYYLLAHFPLLPNMLLSLHRFGIPFDAVVHLEPRPKGVPPPVVHDEEKEGEETDEADDTLMRGLSPAGIRPASRASSTTSKPKGPPPAVKPPPRQIVSREGQRKDVPAGAPAPAAKVAPKKKRSNEKTPNKAEKQESEEEVEEPEDEDGPKPVVIIPREGMSMALARLRYAIHMEPHDSPLKDVCLLTIQRVNDRDVLEVFDELAARLYDLLKKRVVHKAWLETMKVVVVPPAQCIRPLADREREQRELEHRREEEREAALEAGEASASTSVAVLAGSTASTVSAGAGAAAAAAAGTAGAATTGEDHAAEGGSTRPGTVVGGGAVAGLDMSHYLRVMAGVPEAASSVALVLNAVVEQIERSAEGEQRLVQMRHEESRNALESMFDSMLARLTTAEDAQPRGLPPPDGAVVDGTIATVPVDDAPKPPPSLNVVHFCDTIALRTLDHPTTLPTERHMQALMPVPNVVALAANPALPPEVRTMQKQALTHHFSRLPPLQAERTQLLQSLERLLAARDTSREWHFYDRTFCEEFDCETMIQVLADVKLSDADVFTEYYAADDVLLVAAVQTMTHRRERTREWESRVRNKLGLGRFVEDVDHGVTFFDIATPPAPFVFVRPEDKEAPAKVGVAALLASKVAATGAHGGTAPPTRRLGRKKEEESAPPPPPPPAYAPTSYEIGDLLVRVKERAHFMYPADGGQIKVVTFAEGHRKTVNTTLRIGGATVSFHHMLPPKPEPAHPPAVPVPPLDVAAAGAAGAHPAPTPTAAPAAAAKAEPHPPAPAPAAAAPASAPAAAAPAAVGTAATAGAVVPSTGTPPVPADHAPSPVPPPPNQASVTIVYPGGSLACASEEGGAVSLDLTTIDGLMVRCGLHGIVQQARQPRPDAQHSPVGGAGGEHELGRCVFGKGTVIRYLADSSVNILFANGNMAHHAPPPAERTWSSTMNSGERLSRKDDSSTPLPAVHVATHTDPATGDIITRRDDLVELIARRDGTHHSIFPDGTRIIADAHDVRQATRLRVERSECAAVAVDLENNRTVVEMPDGSTVELAPESVLYRKDGTWLRAQPGGIKFGPEGVSEYDDRNRLTKYGVYSFDTVGATMRMADREHHVYTVSNEGVANVNLHPPRRQPNVGEVTTEVLEQDVACLPDNADADSGEGGDTVPGYGPPSLTVPPRLLVVRRDGSGYELLPETVAVSYLTREEQRRGATIVADPLSGDHESTCFTVIAQLPPPDTVLVRQLVRHSQMNDVQRAQLAEDVTRFEQWQTQRQRGVEGLSVVDDRDPALIAEGDALAQQIVARRGDRVAFLREEADAALQRRADEGRRIRDAERAATEAATETARKERMNVRKMGAAAEREARAAAKERAKLRGEGETREMRAAREKQEAAQQREASLAKAKAAPPVSYFDSDTGRAFLTTESNGRSVGFATEKRSHAARSNGNGTPAPMEFPNVQTPSTILEMEKRREPAKVVETVPDDVSEPRVGSAGRAFRPRTAESNGQRTPRRAPVPPPVDEGGEAGADDPLMVDGGNGSDVDVRELDRRVPTIPAGHLGPDGVLVLPPIESATDSARKRFKAPEVTVFGTPRKPISVPKATQGARGSEINERFAKVEAPVRRSTKTSSVKLATMNGTEHTLFGFKVFPPELDFGKVACGQTFMLPFTLTNVGVDSCRYRVEQPRSPHLSLHYTPGAVAPGMSAKLEAEFRADIEGEVAEEIRIITEAEVFILPVAAHVMPRSYDPARDRALRGAQTSVRVVGPLVGGTTYTVDKEPPRKSRKQWSLPTSNATPIKK